MTFLGQKVTLGVTFELLWGSPPKVTLESLLSYVEFFGVRGPVAGSHDHNSLIKEVTVLKVIPQEFSGVAEVN